MGRAVHMFYNIIKQTQRNTTWKGFRLSLITTTIHHIHAGLCLVDQVFSARAFIRSTQGERKEGWGAHAKTLIRTLCYVRVYKGSWNDLAGAGLPCAGAPPPPFSSLFTIFLWVMSVQSRRYLTAESALALVCFFILPIHIYIYNYTSPRRAVFRSQYSIDARDRSNSDLFSAPL